MRRVWLGMAGAAVLVLTVAAAVAARTAAAAPPSQAVFGRCLQLSHNIPDREEYFEKYSLPGLKKAEAEVAGPRAALDAAASKAAETQHAAEQANAAWYRDKSAPGAFAASERAIRENGEAQDGLRAAQGALKAAVEKAKLRFWEANVAKFRREIEDLKTEYRNRHCDQVLRSCSAASGSRSVSAVGLATACKPTGFVSFVVTWSPGPHQAPDFQHTLAASCSARIDFRADGTARLSETFTWKEDTIQTNDAGDRVENVKRQQGNYDGTINDVAAVDFVRGTEYFVRYDTPPSTLQVTGTVTTTTTPANLASQTTTSTIDTVTSCWGIVRQGPLPPHATAPRPAADTAFTVSGHIPGAPGTDLSGDEHVEVDTTWSIDVPAGSG